MTAGPKELTAEEVEVQDRELEAWNQRQEVQAEIERQRQEQEAAAKAEKSQRDHERMAKARAARTTKPVWTDEMREKARETSKAKAAERKAQAAETPPEAPPEPEPDPDDEVEKLRRELAAAQAQTEALDPTKNVSAYLFKDTADVRHFYSEAHLVDVALDEWAAENKALVQRGRAPQPEPEGKELEKRVEQTVQQLLIDRTAGVKQRGFMLRVVKMVKPSGQLIEVPLEGQINSFRVGGAERAFAPYKNKGYKVASPYLCQAQSCWNEAVIGADAQFTFGGYCSVDHRNRTEPGDPGSDRNIRPLYG